MSDEIRVALTREAIELFADLDAVPPSRRNAAWRERGRDLMRALGLTDAWWRGLTVCDKRGPPVPSHYVAAIEWEREVLPTRLALLAATVRQ